jgi:glycosyltransferase involved in cell wall biosynthesis
VLEIARRLPDGVFLLAGDGLERAELQRQAPSNVRFLGWVDPADSLAAADVCLLTSDNEGMPLSLIEATLIAHPSVASDVGCVGEVVVDGVTGLLAAPDVDALTEALTRLLDDDAARLLMGEAAQRGCLESRGTSVAIRGEPYAAAPTVSGAWAGASGWAWRCRAVTRSGICL